MTPQQIKELLLKTALVYFKLYNLNNEDIIIINGFIQEVISKLQKIDEEL